MANTTSSSGCSSSSAHKTLPGTSSACSSQSITATHDFVVNDFSLLDGMGLGRCVTSSTFTVGDTEWDISLYPDGRIDTERHVSVLLSFRRGPNNTRAKFSCSLLLDEDDANVLKECKQHTFPAPLTFWWSWPEFVSKSELQEMLKGSSSDSFTIRCVLSVLTSRTEDAEAIVVPPSDLHRDFARMLADGDGADVTINVGDRSFLAHRSVLAARSKVFKAQLFGVMKESNTECLQIEDMDPSVFEMLLHFIYTDSLPESFFEEEDRCVATMHLLVAADRYGLFRLRLMCEEKLRGWIDVHSVTTILRLADQHHREQLKEACMRFISWPDVLRDIMETEEFDDLVTNCPTILWEILDTIAWTQT